MTPTAVVTGASSGIGAATVRRLVKDGFDVVGVARRADRLRALEQETGARVRCLDITDTTAVQGFAAELDACEVLVNNAGGALGADHAAVAAADDWQWMYSVNVLGTLRMTQALLPLLRAASGTATIVTITSTAAFTNYAGGGGYSAAKHAEHALTETLRLELNGERIRVAEIAPGMVRTDEFAVNRLRGDREKAAAVYAGVDRPLTAEDVAECVALVIGLPPHVNVDHLVVRPLAQAAQHKLHQGPLFDRDDRD